MGGKCTTVRYATGTNKPYAIMEHVAFKCPLSINMWIITTCKVLLNCALRYEKCFYGLATLQTLLVNIPSHWFKTH